MQLSPTRLFTCTACGATLPVGEDLVGKQCRCGGCGKVNVVGQETPRRRKAKADSNEQYFGFSCRVCDTRLAALPKHVGRKAKCPDCGAKTEVPPPPKLRPKKKPRAMHGQQYGVWGVDDAPLPSELAAAQPKFYPVWCRVCDTLMHARANQIGKKLTCPDCGAKTIVPEPQEKNPSPSPLVPDGEEYQLDPADVPESRPQPQIVQTPRPTESAVEPIRVERQQRVRPPRWPLLQGVPRMLVSLTTFGWWLWLSVAATLELGLIAFASSPVNDIGSAMMAVAGFAMTFLVGSIVLCAAAAIWLTLLIESSEGNDRLHRPPSWNFIEWMGDAIYFLIAVPVSAAPWWLLASVIPPEYHFDNMEFIAAGGWLISFPLVLLSCLENGSPLEPLSLRLVGTLLKRPGMWAMFHVQTIAMGATSIASLSLLIGQSLYCAVLAAPVAVAVAFVYFRLLGRLAWWLAESLPTDEVKS